MKRDLDDKELEGLLDQLARQKGLHPMSMQTDEVDGEECDRERERGWKASRAVRVLVVALAASVLISISMIQFAPNRESSDRLDTVENPRTASPRTDDNPANTDVTTEDPLLLADETPWYQEAIDYVGDETLLADQQPESEAARRAVLRAVGASPISEIRRTGILIGALKDPSQLIRKSAAIALQMSEGYPSVFNRLKNIHLPVGDWQTRINLFHARAIQDLPEVPIFVLELLHESIDALSPSAAMEVIAYCVNRGLPLGDKKMKLLDLLSAVAEGEDAVGILHAFLSIEKDRLDLDPSLREMMGALLGSEAQGVQRSAFRAYLRWIGVDQVFLANAGRDLMAKRASLEALHREGIYISQEKIADVRLFSIAALAEPDLRPFVYPILLRLKGPESLPPLLALLQKGALRPGEADRIRLTIVAIDGSTLSPQALNSLSLDSTDPEELVMILDGLRYIHDDILRGLDLIPDDLFRILDTETNEGCLLGAMRLLHRIGQGKADVKERLRQRLSDFVRHDDWFLRFISRLFLAHSVSGDENQEHIAALVDSMTAEDRSPVFMSHLKEIAPALYDSVRTDAIREASLAAPDLEKLVELIDELELASFRENDNTKR